jgi:propanediol dehydratase small subunit
MEYPFYETSRGRLRLPGGRKLEELTLEAVLEGRIGPAELGIAPETLRAQAEVAEGAGFRQLAATLRRAAELARLPEEKVLAIYEALRPRRASARELEAVARELEEVHGAPLTAAFVREAARSGITGQPPASRG